MTNQPQRTPRVALPQRPTKREFGEAMGVLKNEMDQLLAFSTKYADDLGGGSYRAKLVGQSGRKAERIRKVIAWMEDLYAA